MYFLEQKRVVAKLGVGAKKVKEFSTFYKILSLNVCSIIIPGCPGK